MHDEQGPQRAKQILMHLSIQNALQRPIAKAGPVFRRGCHNQPTACHLKHGFFRLWRESSDGDVDGPTETRDKFTSN